MSAPDNMPDWKVFEKIVTRIHQTLSPKAKVVHDDKIPGQDTKQHRQIDISVRQDIGPHPILIIVQCRKYKNKIDLNDVEQFASVIKDVRANAGVVVSNAGFTEGAVGFARNQGINLCSIFDAESKDWSVLVELPVICDFRRPIMRARFKGKTTKDVIERLTTDLNNIELVRETGEVITLRKLFLDDWNDGKVKADLGQHIHIPTETNLRIRSRDGRLWPMEITFLVEIVSRLFFGYVGIEKGEGIVSITNHSFTTKDMILHAIDVVEVENSWKGIASLDDAPQKPFMILMALDTFPEEGILSMDEER